MFSSIEGTSLNLFRPSRMITASGGNKQNMQLFFQKNVPCVIHVYPQEKFVTARDLKFF